MTNNAPTPKAFFFDLDGTLLDTAPDLAAAVNHSRKEVLSLPPLPLEQLRVAVTQGTHALVSIGGNLVDGDPLFNTFRETMLGYYLSHVADLTRPFPGVDGLLKFLDQSDIPWGIVTNKPETFAKPLCRAVGYESRTVCLVCGDTTPKAKPHPDHLLLAAEEINHKPEQCVYVGDAASDMLASQRAGMFGVAAMWGYLEPNDDPSSWPATNMTIDHPSELTAWIHRS